MSVCVTSETVQVGDGGDVFVNSDENVTMTVPGVPTE